MKKPRDLKDLTIRDVQPISDESIKQLELSQEVIENGMGFGIFFSHNVLIKWF